MNKKQKLKNKLDKFYKDLSLLRKETKFSKSMDYVLSDSTKKEKKLLGKIKLNESIADIGGADGKFIFELADENKLTKESDVTLIDISPHYLKRAKQKYNKKYKGKFKFRIFESDVNDLNLKEKFDIIIFRNIMEHLYFPDEALKKLNKALKRGGILFLATPNRDRLNEKIKILIPKKFKRNLKLKFGTDVPEALLLEEKTGLKEHIHEYSLGELKKILQKNNFKIENIGYSTIPFIVSGICDKFPIIFKIQFFIIKILNFLRLNRFLGFEYILLSRKK